MLSSDEEDSTDLSDHLEIITFSPEVEAALQKVLPSDDPLDQPDISITEYINSLFPTEQSLTNIDDVISSFESRIASIDDEMRVIIRGQTNNTEEAQAALLGAKQLIQQLLSQADRIKKQAEASEESVREITQDIKELDIAKKNLTTVITALNHLQMLLSGVETLQMLSHNRQYGDILLPLQGVQEVMGHFSGYLDIPQVAQLSEEVQKLRASLAQQISSDFRQAFQSGSKGSSMSLPRLADAARVVSILDEHVRSELITWFQELQLAEYVQLFQESQDSAWLDKIDKRYAWFKRHLIDMEERYGQVFPEDWELSERLAVEFCKITRNELTKMMAKRSAEIDVKLLLFAIQRTENFENLLAKRFTGITLDPKNVILRGETEDGQAAQKHPFSGLIGECFESHLHIYVASLDRNLADLMERFVTDSKQFFATSDVAETEAVVLPSCGDLFVFYKKCLVQCSQLSTSYTMLSLCHTFQKYLKEYGIKVLQPNLPSRLTATVKPAEFLQNLLREGEATVRLDNKDIRRVCCVLITSEYCADTISQLEEKLKEKISPELQSKISLSEEQDLFNSIIGACLQILVQDLDNACDAALVAMTKMNWSAIDSVGDQSGYVTSIATHLKNIVPIIRDQLASSRKYFTKYCTKFASGFINKFTTSLYKCRGVSTTGAEQLLLDTHSLKTLLLNLPSINSLVQRNPPPSYTKTVMKGMERAEMILKVVMSPIETEKIFVDQVARLLPDIDRNEFQKLLDMKGIKKSEQQNFLELRRDAITTSADKEATSGGLLDTSRVRKLEKLITGK